MIHIRKWQDPDSFKYLDLDKVVGYSILLNNANTAAKVVFFLGQHRGSLMIEDEQPKPHIDFRPRRPHYLERSKRSTGRFVKNWKLILPEEIFNRSRGEVL